jgi:CTP:molybdopterin cytidylyltransferase MocA
VSRPPSVVVLAAGGGTRFTGDTHKLAAPIGATTVLASAVAAAVDSGVGPVTVVWGAWDPSGALPPTVRLVRNERWVEGQATSLRVAIDDAALAGFDVLVVGLGDQPGVPAEAWRRVASSPGGPIVSASFDGARRPPVRLDREVWPLVPTEGDAGARSLFGDHPELVTVVDCDGDPADIDTVEDLARWT